MNLSSRLQAVINMLDLSGPVADIGTDHAYLPIYLARQTDCSQIIASEYTEAPYQVAVEQIKKAKAEDKVELRKGFGLSVLNKKEVEEIIIAGMGGFTIQEIIAGQLSIAQAADKLVLQPMSGLSELRSWLVDNGFTIIDEQLAKEEDKLYQVWWVRAGEMELDDPFLLAVGPKLIEKKDPLLLEFLTQLEDEWQQIVKQLKLHRPESSRLSQLQQKLNRLREVKRCL